MNSADQIEEQNSTPDYFPEPGSFRGAYNQINITPQISDKNPIFLQGLAGPHRRAITVSAPLMLQMLLLEDDRYSKILVITGDIFGFGPEITENVRAAAGEWGIEPEAIILNASHTLYAPGTISHGASSLGPFYKEYALKIIDIIVKNLPFLFSKLGSCELSRGKIEAQLGSNIKLSGNKTSQFDFEPDPDGFYLRHTPFLMVNFIKNNSKVLLINHGCLPGGLDRENTISADYPAYLRESLTANKDASAVMFLQGASGNTRLTDSMDEKVIGCEGAKGAQQKGELLAELIRAKLKQKLEPVRGSFFCINDQALLPFRELLKPEQIEKKAKNEEEHFLIREWAFNILKKFPSGYYPKFMALPIQLISIGREVSFMTFPGELSAELGQRVRRLSRNPDGAFVLGCTNGLISFLPTDRIIEKNEAKARESCCAYLVPSTLAIGTESAIMARIKESLEKSEPEKANGRNKLYLGRDTGQAFFVLSAESSRTAILSRLLNTATNAQVLHYPRPHLIKEALQAYWMNLDRIKTFWALRYPIMRRVWSKGFIYGETGHFLTSFADMLAEEMPQSKFIILTMDPRRFVRSGLQREYYHNNIWDNGRFKPREGSMEFDAWRNLNQFEKICWLWRETYEKTLELTNGIAAERLKMVRLEDLLSDVSKIEELFSFLGLEGCNHSAIKQILENNTEAFAGNGDSDIEAWTGNLLKKLERECGKLARQFAYYDLSEDYCPGPKIAHEQPPPEKAEYHY